MMAVPPVQCSWPNSPCRHPPGCSRPDHRGIAQSRTNAQSQTIEPRHGTRCRVAPPVLRGGFRFALAFRRNRVHFDVRVKENSSSHTNGNVTRKKYYEHLEENIRQIASSRSETCSIGRSFRRRRPTEVPNHNTRGGVGTREARRSNRRISKTAAIFPSN